MEALSPTTAHAGRIIQFHDLFQRVRLNAFRHLLIILPISKQVRGRTYNVAHRRDHFRDSGRRHASSASVTQWPIVYIIQ